jgi:hypothetical protein
MNKLNFKLKLNKVYERNFKTRKKIWEIKKILNEVEKEHTENYESIEFLLDILFFISLIKISNKNSIDS